MKSSVVYKFKFLLNFNPSFTVGNLLTQSRTVDSENECVYITGWSTNTNHQEYREMDGLGGWPNFSEVYIILTYQSLLNWFWFDVNQKPFTVYESVPIVLLTKQVWAECINLKTCLSLFLSYVVLRNCISYAA